MGQSRHPYLSALDSTKGSPQDRRLAHRYPVVEGKARIGWWSGEHFKSVVAHLVDISQHGALLAAEEVPPPDQPVHLFLELPSPGLWVDASVVGLLEAVGKFPRLRLSFSAPCPYTSFKAAVYGEAALKGHPQAVPVDPEGRDWFY